MKKISCFWKTQPKMESVLCLSYTLLVRSCCGHQDCTYTISNFSLFRSISQVAVSSLIYFYLFICLFFYCWVFSLCWSVQCLWAWCKRTFVWVTIASCGNPNVWSWTVLNIYKQRKSPFYTHIHVPGKRNLTMEPNQAIWFPSDTCGSGGLHS
jgi:hypothetical protein